MALLEENGEKKDEWYYGAEPYSPEEIGTLLKSGIEADGFNTARLLQTVSLLSTFGINTLGGDPPGMSSCGCVFCLLHNRWIVYWRHMLEERAAIMRKAALKTHYGKTKPFNRN